MNLRSSETAKPCLTIHGSCPRPPATELLYLGQNHFRNKLLACGIELVERF